jgi:dihydrofolate reductase
VPHEVNRHVRESKGETMRVVVYEFMSLDGVVQAPGGASEDTEGGFAHGGWSVPYFDPDVMGAEIAASMDTTDALLFGRRTWRGMADAWPGRAGDPYADKMNALPKYVASRTLREGDMEWNSTLLPADRTLDAIAALRRQGGRDIQVWGSATLVRDLIASGLVDELRLMIEPIILGGGKRIFPDGGQAHPLKLVSARTTGTGVQLCVYRPVAGG